jgi:pyruvate/2-oxoglutarate dehydrogenase complex dihydrolipoamide acyltransferase (E2) component
MVRRHRGVRPDGGALVAVDTEKVTTAIEADAAGVLFECRVDEDAVAAVGSVIC